jgi:hypothetical protein
MPKYADFHDEVVDILFELCRGYKAPTGKDYYSSVFADHIGQNYEPIILSGSIRRHKPFARNYYPDVWAQISRKQQYDIYEVWHSETEAQAVQDIVFSSLVKGAQYIDIICTGENLTGDDAEQLTHLILRDDDDENKTFQIYDVPQNLRSNNAKLKKYLRKELGF